MLRDDHINNMAYYGHNTMASVCHLSSRSSKTFRCLDSLSGDIRSLLTVEQSAGQRAICNTNFICLPKPTERRAEVSLGSEVFRSIAKNVQKFGNCPTISTGHFKYSVADI